MRYTRHYLILTTEDLRKDIPPEILEDPDAFRASGTDYFNVDCLEPLRRASVAVFCTPDDRYIGLKHRDMPEKTLDRM